MGKNHEGWAGSPGLIREGNESERLWPCCTDALVGKHQSWTAQPTTRKIRAVWPGLHPSLLATGATALQSNCPGHGAAPCLSPPPHGSGHCPPRVDGRQPSISWSRSAASGAQRWKHLGLCSCCSIQHQPHAGAAARDGQAKRDCTTRLFQRLGFCMNSRVRDALLNPHTCLLSLSCRSHAGEETPMLRRLQNPMQKCLWLRWARANTWFP